MKMLRYLGLMVFVVFITAFASGCGGGGGGGSAMMEMEEEMPQVMECPQGQVGTYPDCMDPGPTDAELIENAQDTLADIVADARVRETAALAAYRAVILHPDVTEADIDLAIDYALNAQTFLAEITAASAAANAATTPAQAESALAEARASLGDLTLAQSGAEGIQIALQTAATPPPGQTQTVTDVGVLTNNSSLIQHVRANKLLSDALLGDLEAARLSVAVASAESATGVADTRVPCAAPCAEFPDTIGSGDNRITGARTVRIQPTDASETLVSNSKTPTLSGPGRFNGFDLKNEAGTLFVNAYTDVSQEVRGERKNDRTIEDDDMTAHDERYDYKPDTDYLLVGIWLKTDNSNLVDSEIGAFAYGSEALTDPADFCTNAESNVAGTPSRVCAEPTGFANISSFVDDGEDVTATYQETRTAPTSREERRAISRRGSNSPPSSRIRQVVKIRITKAASRARSRTSSPAVNPWRAASSYKNQRPTWEMI